MRAVRAVRPPKPSLSANLASCSNRVVSRRSPREILFENEVPTAPAEEVTIEELDDLAVARESEVEDAIDGWRDRADERRKSQTGEMVDKLISEHRADRGGNG